jgi:hypothetical protein
MKLVFLKTTSRLGCGLSGWSFCSRQKQTPFLLDLSVLFSGARQQNFGVTFASKTAPAKFKMCQQNFRRAGKIINPNDFDMPHKKKEKLENIHLVGRSWKKPFT